MSTLAELFPAGAGKEVDFTASGAITAAGKPVILNSAGTVTEAGMLAAGGGTEVVFDTANSNYLSGTFDSNAGKVVIVYNNGTTSGNAIVGTVSGKEISFGSTVVFEAANTSNIAATFDSTNNKIILAYRDNGNSYYGTAIVGTVSGTTITFGSAVVFESANTQYTSVAHDSTNNKMVIAYKDDANSGYGTAIVGTVSGTAISFGSAVVFESASTWYTATHFDSTSGKIVIAYSDAGNSDYGTALVGTVSGTSISFGSPYNNGYFESAGVTSVSISSAGNNKICISYADKGNSYYGTAVIGDISGTLIYFGTPAVYFSQNPGNWPEAVWEPTFGPAGEVVISYARQNIDGDVAVITVRVAGQGMTFGTPVTVGGGNAFYTHSASGGSGKIVTFYSDNANSDDGTAVVYSGEYTNVTADNFLGVSKAAISNAASGTIVLKGGLVTDFPAQDIPSAGSYVNFTTNRPTMISEVFDSNANKVVVFYQDYGNSSYGTAAVGTVSGNTTSWGTPVVFNSGEATENNAVFDSNANKIINVYKDGGASNYGNAIVGTVSGTSISFGSEATWNAGSTTNIGAAFDSTANKVVIAYRDDSNGDASSAVVGTVSGTSISFGSEVVFRDHPSPGRGNKHKVVYDSNANKSVICFAIETNGYGTSTVVTLSGTTPSFGSEATFKSANIGSLAPVFDSNSNKVVIPYSHSSNKGSAVVGTISGTGISFGTEAEFIDAGVSVKSGTFDSGSNKIMVGYTYTADGWLAVGTVSGTGISFGTSINFTDPNNADPSGLAYDSNADKTVVCYSDTPNTDGRAIVLSPTSALTPASDYYVQGDGSITTTTTSPAVKIGRALSGTILDLEYQS